jgi:hypothetical protein
MLILMNTRSDRRDFIKGLAYAGMVLPRMTQAATQALAGPRPTAHVDNEAFAVAFDAQKGRFDVWRRGGETFLSGATLRANTNRGTRTTSEPAYRHTVQTLRLQDQLGQGQQLVVHSPDTERQLDLELRITLYDNQSMLLVEAVCRNVSAQSVTLESLEPVCATRQMGGALLWPEATKILTNGPMYYDPGVIADLALPDAKPLRSWWNIGVFRGYQQDGLACGYVDNQAALGQIVVQREDHDAISLTAESVLAKRFVLPPGQAIRSGRFLFVIAPDPYAALEAYADAMGRAHSARINSIVNGWCSWFYTYEHVTEDEVIRNAEFAARVLKPLGLQYIQVDEGYQRWHGDWEGNDKFPHGMKWLADRIRAMGLKPGLWIAPYVISEPTELFQKHPDWLLRHPDGQLKRVGPWPSEDSDWARNENPKRYGLDITHPAAAAWLANLFDTVAKQWGYEMLKIDFVDWSLLSAERYHDPAVTRAEAYRKGFEIMRQTVGPQCHLQDCGPGPVTVGLLDSMRIELDQNYGFRHNAWKQYFLSSTSSAPAAAKRYYFHKRTWINDADHVCLSALSLSQAQAAATLIALSGGNLISGDRLPDLDPARLEILKKVLPSWGEAARPMNLFDTDLHTVFALPVRKSFGEWTIVGVFNPSEKDSIQQGLPLERLWLDPRKTYLAYDFWREAFHGEVAGELTLTVPPASVSLLALHEKSGIPRVISTDRHVLQGAHELESVVWSPQTRTLEGVSLGPPASAHNVAVHIPEAHPWRQGGPFLFRDFPGYTLKMVDEHLLRIRVRFDQRARTEWKICLDDFFTGA